MVALFALGISVGCEPTYSGSGCGSRPKATDAAFGAIRLQSTLPPCTMGLEAPRGSAPHLIVSFQCAGESDPFLVAVKVDGELKALREVAGAVYGSQIWVDAGPWEPSDSAWHDVEAILDPLDLFKETDESNNRGRERIRITEPDASIDADASGFIIPYDVGGDNFTLVSQVPSGTPVNVRLRMIYGGSYPGIRRSVRSGAALGASDTIEMVCPDYGNRNDFVTRWTPPGPGDYDVEFRLEPQGSVPDANLSNDVVTKRLTVTPSMARRIAARPAPGSRP